MDRPTDQPKLDSSSLRLTAQEILGCIRLTIIANYHSLKPSTKEFRMLEFSLGYMRYQNFSAISGCFPSCNVPLFGSVWAQICIPHLGTDHTISISDCLHADRPTLNFTVLMFVAHSLPMSDKRISMENISLRYSPSWKLENHLRVINFVKLCFSSLTLCFPIYWIL